MRVHFTLGSVPNVHPAIGSELYRTDSNGAKTLLTGFDHNRELMRRLIERSMAASSKFRMDAASLALSRDLIARKREFWEQAERPLVAEQFVPMDPEAASFRDAREYEWEMRTKLGQAAMHQSLNGVTEAPSVDEHAEFAKATIVNALISYGWTVEEELFQGRLNYNFANRRAMLAKEAIDRAFDNFLLTGGTFGGKTFYGLFNLAAVTPYDADVSGTGDWHTIPTTTTVAQFFADFHALYNAWLDDAYKAGSELAADVPDTIAMSDRIESKLRSTAVGTDNRTDLLTELKSRYPEIANWLVHRDLRGINGTSTDDRIVMYRKDPRILAAAVPVPYQEQPMIQEPFAQRIYAFGRIAPVEVHDLRLIKYLDVKIAA